jgi:putative transposase
VSRHWRLDETDIRVRGRWHDLYRAVDQAGQTIDVLSTTYRDEPAAKRFLTRAIRRHGVPETVTIDGSEANAAAIRSNNSTHGTTIVIRQVRYLTNVVEQDHHAVKRVVWPTLGFKAFETAQHTLAGVELMHMWHKGQWTGGAEQGLTAAEQCYALAV